MEGDLTLAPARVCPHSPWPSFLPLWCAWGSTLRSARAELGKSRILGQGIVVLAASLRLALLLSPLFFFFFICHKCFLEFENTRLSQLYSGKEFGTTSNAGRLLPRIEAKQAGNMKGAHCICCRSRNMRGPLHLPFLRLKKRPGSFAGWGGGCAW